MISIGLAGWGDHQDIYEEGTKPREKLKKYSSHFSVVEVDSSFYAIQGAELFSRWVSETPREFSFLVKAYQGMTGHLRSKSFFADRESMYLSFQESIAPVLEAGKLKAVLFQYPPWFDCTSDNIKILRGAKLSMGDIPVALEFRHQSWFAEGVKEKTLHFMEQEGWIHSICDEPQAGMGSVPLILAPTNSECTVVRMHGRNRDGWNQSNNANWREVRYLYDYSRQELQEWKEYLNRLQESTKEIVMIFNNNSGGHAARNAKEMMRLLGQQPLGLAPRQLDLF